MTMWIIPTVMSSAEVHVFEWTVALEAEIEKEALNVDVHGQEWNLY